MEWTFIKMRSNKVNEIERFEYLGFVIKKKKKKW